MPSLRIRLHGRDVGILSKDTRTRFRLLQAYLDLPRRPVLGQAFEEDLRARRTAGGGRLPPFFSNMLPEGALRSRLAKAIGAGEDDEFALLSTVGEDLPGAVTAIPMSELYDEPAGVADEEEAPLSPPREDGTLRFSLAGVQLKMSMLREGERLTVPASGQAGDWIVKLPSPSFPFLPENEHATMTWAERAGIRVAEHQLVPLHHVQGAAELLAGVPGETAFVTKRYDREPGRRVHQEDFAQVLDVYADRKYDATNSESIANIIFRLTGFDGLAEYIRRLVFVVLSGNGDAHLKNWSLYYPDDIRAELSPAYDFVSTVQYLHSDKLALKLARSKLFEDVTVASFLRLARKIEADEAQVGDVVRQSVAAMLDAWREIRGEPVVSKSYRAGVEAHLEGVPLARTP